ncbi:MAG: hypothetical protein WCP21_05160 [Armatimonadota bacterium]
MRKFLGHPAPTCPEAKATPPPRGSQRNYANGSNTSLPAQLARKADLVVLQRGVNRGGQLKEQTSGVRE